MSDQKHLTNLSGDKKACSVYISIGNLPSTRRNRPGSLVVLLLALLPVPPKLAGTSSTNKLQRQINADTPQAVFQLIGEPVKAPALEGVQIDCAASAKNYPASDTAPLRPDARDVESASPASCAS